MRLTSILLGRSAPRRPPLRLSLAPTLHRAVAIIRLCHSFMVFCCVSNACIVFRYLLFCIVGFVGFSLLLTLSFNLVMKTCEIRIRSPALFFGSLSECQCLSHKNLWWLLLFPRGVWEGFGDLSRCVPLPVPLLLQLPLSMTVIEKGRNHFLPISYFLVVFSALYFYFWLVVKEPTHFSVF
jgi:hypothetical protein